LKYSYEILKKKVEIHIYWMRCMAFFLINVANSLYNLVWPFILLLCWIENWVCTRVLLSNKTRDLQQHQSYSSSKHFLLVSLFQICKSKFLSQWHGFCFPEIANKQLINNTTQLTKKKLKEKIGIYSLMHPSKPCQEKTGVSRDWNH